jgi:hypothetical protein
MAADPKTAAAAALRAASSAVALGGIASKPGPYAWVLPAAREALAGAAELVEATPVGLTAADRRRVSDAIRPTLERLPGVLPVEARDLAEGVSALVTVIRRWVAG